MEETRRVTGDIPQKTSMRILFPMSLSFLSFLGKKHDATLLNTIRF